MLPEKLQALLGMRYFSGSLRKLTVNRGLVDFASNDYLGFSKLELTQTKSSNGATGSRLISGHSDLHHQIEEQIAAFHNAPAALLFNSGYDANIGLIPALTDRADLILLINWFMLAYGMEFNFLKLNRLNTVIMICDI